MVRLGRAALLAAGVSMAAVAGAAALRQDAKPYLGRWDLTVEAAHPYPSWLEITEEGGKLAGRFVGRVGSARPLATVELKDGGIEFSLPPQFERRKDTMRFSARLQDRVLSGTTTDEAGAPLKFSGRRAPRLVRRAEPVWGEPVELFDGSTLSGWQPREADKPNGWVVENGALYNKTPGNDLLTTAKFRDFKLHAEFNLPKGSNSGIYLRGRYEMQIEDNFGKPASNKGIGAIYGFLTPSKNASKPAGEWQTVDITLVGRKVTIVLNGEKIIDNEEIPGITGGALDSAEGQPGPLYIQGDHGPVWFRKVTLTPAKMP
jgi:hypothetical protein